MVKMSTTKTPLLSGNWYHIYNRGINGERLFFEKENYTFFLKQLAQHVLGVAEIYSYCLLGNHFHLLVRIHENLKKQPHLGFSHFFNSYSQAINKRFNRTGGLFERPFRRKIIESESYRAQLVFYIHHNPVHHSLTQDFQFYPHSSYRAILSKTDTRLMRNEVLQWFSGEKGFIAFHQREPNFETIKDCIIEIN